MWSDQLLHRHTHSQIHTLSNTSTRPHPHTVKALIHYQTWSFDLISCYRRGLTLTSPSDLVTRLIGIKPMLFSSGPGHQITNEIAYHIWLKLHSYWHPKTDCWLCPIKPRQLGTSRTVAHFSVPHCWHHPTKCWWYQYLTVLSTHPSSENDATNSAFLRY